MDTNYMTKEDTQRFKSYMVGAGYTITTLAKSIGMARESLSARINGRVDFGRNEMVSIAKKLNKTPTEIFLS